MLTQRRLKELLRYDPATGVFTWRSSGKGRRSAKGLVAGCLSKHGNGKDYWKIRVDGVLYHAHRLAWFYRTGKWPQQHTDHRVGNSNRVSNLRPCTPSQNAANSKLRSDNTSGFKGVSKVQKCNRWRAQLNTDYLGVFKTPQEAARRYDTEAVARFGPFALTNKMLGLL